MVAERRSIFSRLTGGPRGRRSGSASPEPRTATGDVIEAWSSPRRWNQGRGHWLAVGLTCFSTLLPLSIAACAELGTAATGGPAASGPSAEAAAPATPSPQTSERAIASAIGQQIAAETPVVVGGQSYPSQDFATFYQSRSDQPVWVSGEGLTAKGESLVASLKALSELGFNPRLYLPEILPAAGASASDLARGELELSAGLVRYANNAQLGISPPRRNDASLSVPEKVIDPTGVLLSAVGAPDLAAYVDRLQPHDRVYLGLREALKRYRALDASGAWQTLTPAMSLRPGDSNDNVGRLRQSLVLMGDLPAGTDTTSSVFDENMVAAVRRFQRRHDIAASGSIDAATRSAYNVTPDARVRQILVNMERRRWMPTDLGTDHILVNLPSYSLDVVENDKSVLNMRVVIGKPNWPTPVFSDVMEYLEFNPYWTVPPGILKKEVLPKMRNNPGYAASAGLKVYYNGKPVNPSSVDWSTAGRGYSFRQDPGERNALGKIKFMFPNQYAVYLHDTPSKSLFGRSQRAFSHGCVRVEKPMDLAVYVLNRNADGWSEKRIDQTIRARKNRSVRLDAPLPVHLAYFTVWLDSDGSVQFRNDVYTRDTTLERTMSASAG